MLALCKGGDPLPWKRHRDSEVVLGCRRDFLLREQTYQVGVLLVMDRGAISRDFQNSKKLWYM